MSDWNETEIASLSDNIGAACMLADAMHLNGAGVMSGDVLHALARLGLRLVSVDDPEHTSGAAAARFDALTETVPCGCGLEWVRLRDVDSPGAGWWHHGNTRHAEGFWRKCEAGERRAPRRR